MTENTALLVGNLTDDPELRYLEDGSALATFRLAVDRRVKDEAGNWTDGPASFFTVTCWPELAENIAESLARGARVAVVGRLRQRSWETPEGEKRSVVEVEADEVAPSLRWATATVQRQGVAP